MSFFCVVLVLCMLTLEKLNILTSWCCIQMAKPARHTKTWNCGTMQAFLLCSIHTRHINCHTSKNQTLNFKYLVLCLAGAYFVLCLAGAMCRCSVSQVVYITCCCCVCISMRKCVCAWAHASVCVLGLWPRQHIHNRLLATHNKQLIYIWV